MSWVDQAACRGMDVNIFFPKQNEFARARKVCKDCPVQQPCLLSTINRDNDNYGMYGGLTPMERHTLREGNNGRPIRFK